MDSDFRNEKIGYKIREAQLQKLPYMLVVGEKEAAANTVSVRNRKGENATMTLDEFIARLTEEAATKAR